MAQIDFTVNTAPMAQKIDGVKTEVGVVGAAVTAMQAAVVASEKMASDKICQSIDNGFYMLMRSRLSQRVAQFSSTMNSRVGSMMETASAIEHTHEQMLGDFNRIKARYVKLFNSLDRNLEKRVRELDREAMALAQVRDTFLTKRQCGDVPSVLTYATDITAVALKASNASLKKKATTSISRLGEETRQIMGYARQASTIFEARRPTEASGSESPLCYVPVVYAVTENLAAPDSYAMQLQTPAAMDPRTQAGLAAEVRRNQDKLEGSDGQDLVAIRTSFANKVAQSGMDDRTSQTMMNLLDASLFSARPSAGGSGTSMEPLPPAQGDAQMGGGR